MFRFSSNLTRPSNMFCEISVSVSASAMAGSSVPKSERIGKDSVWLEARLVPVFPPPPPHATSARLATPPTARALRIRNEDGVIAFPYQSLRPSLFPPAFFPVSSRDHRGESAPTRGGDRAPPLTPPPIVALPPVNVYLRTRADLPGRGIIGPWLSVVGGCGGRKAGARSTGRPGSRPISRC